MLKLIFIVLLLISSPAVADEWTTGDTGREVAYQVLLGIDWAQTRSFIRDKRYWEQNPCLGNHPSKDKVDLIVVLSSLGHYAISKALPEEYRDTFQSISIGFELGAVAHNFSIGVKAKF